MKTIKKYNLLSIFTILGLIILLSGCLNVEKRNSYFVRFYINDELVSHQVIEENGSAIAPVLQDIEGYVFIGWDSDFSCVTENLIINAILEKYEDTDLGKLETDLKYLKQELENITIENLSKLPSKGKTYNSNIEWINLTTNAYIDDQGNINIIESNGECNFIAILSLNDSIIFEEFVF